MCTAITYQSADFYFGRTLDYERAYVEEVTVSPRNFPFCFRHTASLPHHHAIIGMAYVAKDYPLYYDAVNEKGLGMAGLNFVGNASYRPPTHGKDNVATFEFIPWILGRCASVQEARTLLANVNLTNTAFSEELPPAELHWLIADEHETITVEAVANGLQIYDNPVGVLTNNPPFPQQLFHLNDYMHLSPHPPTNNFSDKLNLTLYSRGMGALGLPGDLSSRSRFVRAAFARLNAVSDRTEAASVSQCFHILGTVEQTRGCCAVGDDGYEITIYTACCNASRGIYYYTTYDNRRIAAVDMHREQLDGAHLSRYPLMRGDQIAWQN